MEQLMNPATVPLPEKEIDTALFATEIEIDPLNDMAFPGNAKLDWAVRLNAPLDALTLAETSTKLWPNTQRRPAYDPPNEPLEIVKLNEPNIAAILWLPKFTVPLPLNE